MIGILVCDDHRIVREGIKQMLADATDMQVVAEAASGEEALALVNLQRQALAVVLLDVALPGRDGLDVLQQIRRDQPTLPVLMLSTYPERQYAVRCLRLGAAGYLNKSADPADMLGAIRKVAAGGIYVAAGTAEALAAAVGNKPGTQALSHREQQVFDLLILGHSVSQIGAQLKLASNTISTYRVRILEKTSTKNDVELALYAQRLGKPD